MSATEELRRLLDERGVEWGSGFGGDTLWTGKDGIEWRWDKQENTLAMYSHAITPAQAIAATLGVGTCHNVHEPPKDETFWPAPHFKCSECGSTHVSMEYVFYCPNCGRKVVDE